MLCSTTHQNEISFALTDHTQQAGCGLQLTEAHPHASLPPCSNHGRHGRMLTSGFSMQGFPKLGLGVPATYGIKVGLKKLESWATCR